MISEPKMLIDKLFADAFAEITSVLPRVRPKVRAIESLAAATAS